MHIVASWKGAIEDLETGTGAGDGDTARAASTCSLSVSLNVSQVLLRQQHLHAPTNTALDDVPQHSEPSGRG